MAQKLKQKKSRQMVESILAVEADNQTTMKSEAEIKSADTRQSWWFGLSRNGKLLLVGIIVFVGVGVFGAGFKYLEEDARRQQSDNKTLASDVQQKSFLNRINPFIVPPLPTPTPRLSKEYVYAGSRLLAVEDVKPAAAPPADLAVWRESTGTWLVMGGEGSQQTGAQWGEGNDIPVPGDFDGDGKTDFSIFRPSTSVWWILKSSDGNYFTVNFGLSGDKVAPADYDGDGKTDATVYRPSNGTWYIWGSTNGYIAQPFGQTGDIPAPADYDGDGKADIAVWRSGTPANFYYLPSSGGQFQSQTLGQTGDVPVCGDYDGDGRADFALRRDAAWIIRNSSSGQEQLPITLEQATDIPVPNDYDGDGKLDIAVWRNATGYWYIRNSSDNSTRTVQWGQAGDIPVPAFYRR